jgi:hypothetical protein
MGKHPRATICTKRGWHHETRSETAALMDNRNLKLAAYASSKRLDELKSNNILNLAKRFSNCFLYGRSVSDI